ncbi:MAG: hypothetical protein WBM41_06910 [Arenicellales bacterium]
MAHWTSVQANDHLVDLGNDETQYRTMNGGSEIADSPILEKRWSRLTDFTLLPDVDFKLLKHYRLDRTF